jgi:3-oxoadipate enol-lactonase
MTTTLTVRGVELAIDQSGTGMPFFWGHGFTSSMEQEDKFLVMDWARLAGRYRLVRWDARGHGLSRGAPVPDDYRWDNMGRDLLALTDELGVEQFVAGGVSMGGAAALHAAVQAPDRVRGIVLMLPPTAYETRDEQADLYRAAAVLVERLGKDAYLDQLSRLPVAEVVADFGERFRPVPQISEKLLPSVLRGAASSDLPSVNTVQGITAPVLLLPWVGDAGHPMATAERLLELLPDVQIHVAHHLRDVWSWTDRIDEFLERIAAETTSA